MLKGDSLIIDDFRCDYHHSCRILPFAEVIWSKDESEKPLLQKEWCWSYLCLPHFVQEVIIRKHKVGWSLAEWLTRLPLLRRLWNWWAK